MRHAKSLVFPLFPLLILACGDAPPSSLEARPTRSAPLTSAAAPGCVFHIASSTKRGPMPPVKQIIVTREDAGGCPWGGGSVVLDTTYDDSSLSLTASVSGVAVGFTSKVSPSGSAAISVQLRHLDPQTLAVVRGESLSAWNPSHAGYVYDAELSLLGDGTSLRVRGSKEGTLDGEVGAGGNYVAVFPDFFTSATLPSITAGE